ncbi:3-phenylpropionate/cinnamic acid dioxygenase subunit beta [Streptomyces sp. NPDC090106]|uniref:3-phenylpropionate/cinnamic acid dioxygenase subunit beta n=1 Tax=Streptomyces sp. NPDC090106 TaxID=3365946 RepID=UPI0037F55C37
MTTHSPITPAPGAKSSTTSVSLEVQRDIEQFLFEEADVLDAWQFRDWLGMLAEDIHYWAPVRTNRTYRERALEIAAPGESAYFDEDFEELKQRVDRLYTRMAWAEDPPSRTRKLVTNIRVAETDDPAVFTVRSSFINHRSRAERDQDYIVGRRDDIIRRAHNGFGFEIAKRTVLFDVAVLTVKNLSNFY